MPNKDRKAAIEQIKALTKKYNWDCKEDWQLEQILKNYGQAEFSSAVIVKDVAIIAELEEAVKKRAWRLTFNHDDEDGFWAEVEPGYSKLGLAQVADLKKGTKRETMIEAILAAIDFLNKTK